MTMMPEVRDVVLFATAGVGAYVVLSVTYCLWVLLIAAGAKHFNRKQRPTPGAGSLFCLLIPAHNEETVIEGTLWSIGALNYPRHLFTTYVIADNCSDRTGEIASGFPYANVMYRTNEQERGKGYALNWAIKNLPATLVWDAIVVVDADTKLDRSFLAEMDSFRANCTPGRFVGQGRYDVLNANETWRTALLAGALSLVHVVRPMARQCLGFTVGLKGNGMCFDRSVLNAVPWKGDSLTEDIEQALDLLEKENVKVQFVPKAKLAALMPSTSKGATSQRERWENGRSQIVGRRALKLLSLGLMRFKGAYIDAAVDLLLPPLAEMTASIAFWYGLIFVYHRLGGDIRWMSALAVYSLIALLLYIFGGFAVAEAPKMAYTSLLYAPFYTLWKLMLRLKSPVGKTNKWVRTTRETGDDLVDDRQEGTQIGKDV